MSFLFTYPDENIAGDVVPTLSVGVADADNPLANLTTGDPTEPFYTTDSLGVDIRWDRGSATRIDMVSIPIHNIPAGTLVRFQMNATDAWGGPTLDAALTVNAFTEFPDVIFVDLTGVAGYTSLGLRWNRLFVPNHGGITGIGDFEAWTTKGLLNSALEFGPERAFSRTVTGFTRDDGSDFYYDHLRIPRRIKGDFNVEAADFATLQDLWERAFGPVKRFMVQQSSSHEGQYSRWTGGFPPKEVEGVLQKFGVNFKEVGRGSPL